MASQQPADYARLRQEQEVAIQQTDDQIEQWEKYKSDYKALQQRLKTLPDKVTHEVMVPFGSVAFCPGRLVHTNEILVLLGDDWFAKRSAKQAVDIVSRRMKTIDKNIHDLKEQKKLLLPRRDFTEELKRLEKGQSGVQEIREEFDPEAEKAWRERHHASVQRQRRQEAEERERKIQEREKNKDPGKDPLWTRLEALERQEEERGELQPEDLLSYPDKYSSTREEEANSQSLLQTKSTPSPPPPVELPPLSLSRPGSQASQHVGKRVQWEDQKSAEVSVSQGDGDGNDDVDSDDDYSSDEDSDEEDASGAGAEARPRSLKITFAHGTVEQQDSEADDELDGGEARQDVPEIQSPQDIYRLFCKPKSILKQSSTDSPVSIPAPISPPQPAVPDKIVVSMKGSSAFTGTVVQRESPTQTQPDQPSPPLPAEKVSRFRARRQQKSS